MPLRRKRHPQMPSKPIGIPAQVFQPGIEPQGRCGNRMRALDNASTEVHDTHRRRQCQHQHSRARISSNAPPQTTNPEHGYNRCELPPTSCRSQSNESLASVIIRQCGASLTAAGSSPITRTSWVTTQCCCMSQDSPVTPHRTLMKSILLEGWDNENIEMVNQAISGLFVWLGWFIAGS